MATIGRSRAIAEPFGFKLSGFVAWLAWLGVHIWYLIGFRNRAIVMFEWFWAYLTYKRGARLITGSPEPEEAREAATPARALSDRPLDLGDGGHERRAQGAKRAEAPRETH